MKSLVRGALILAVAGLFTGCATLSDKEMDANLTVRTFIDGADLLMVRGDQVWFKHLAYELPGCWQGGDEYTYINGDQLWKPVWKGNDSNKEQILDKDRALPPNKAFTADTLKVKSSGSFGRVDVAEYPSADNDYTLVLSIDDRGPDGAYWYNIGISWQE